VGEYICESVDTRGCDRTLTSSVTVIARAPGSSCAAGGLEGDADGDGTAEEEAEGDADAGADGAGELDAAGEFDAAEALGVVVDDGVGEPHAAAPSSTARRRAPNWRG
jgi:hypothetical protein